ncbi:hypothetical protein OTB20_40525 [Streptomyces sp. H27-H1]|nr:hypothetical protein [Streptomyces sp. H27-H1]
MARLTPSAKHAFTRPTTPVKSSRAWARAVSKTVPATGSSPAAPVSVSGPPG